MASAVLQPDITISPDFAPAGVEGAGFLPPRLIKWWVSPVKIPCGPCRLRRRAAALSLWRQWVRIMTWHDLAPSD